MPRKKTGNITNTAFWSSAERNTYTYVNYFDRLCNLGMSVFKWENLPESIDWRFLELSLMCYGYALFFKDEVMGYLSLRCMIGGRLDVYNIPMERTAYASNGYQNHLDYTNSVLIYDNLLHAPILDDLCGYAKDLYELDQIIRINCNAQKTPILLIASDKERLTLKNLYAKYAGNEPFIFGTDGLNVNNIQAINTGAPFIAPDLYELRTNIWNQALTFLGIPNTSVQKKERLITDEVHQMNGGSIASRFTRLEARRQACEQINRMFPDLSVDVDFRDADEDNMFNVPDDPEAVKNAEDNEQKEGESNEQVHD